MNQDQSKVFRERLIQLRENSRLTQEELSEKAGVSRSCIRGLEVGESFPRADSLMKLADYFHVTTDYLLGRDNVVTLTVGSLPENITQHLRALVHEVNGLAKSAHENLDVRKDVKQSSES